MIRNISGVEMVVRRQICHGLRCIIWMITEWLIGSDWDNALIADRPSVFPRKIQGGQ
jgi:hypothetical protein